MVQLTLIVFTNFNEIKQEKSIEVIYTNEIDNIKEIIEEAKGKYIAFIREKDNISQDYLKIVLNKTNEDFDCCFINYDVLYEYKNKMKIATTESELEVNKPYYGEYLWSFIFNKKKLIQLLSNTKKIAFNKRVDELFTKTTAIGKIIYFHKPDEKSLYLKLPYTDKKRTLFFNNIIYIGIGCNCSFNGYISWLKNIGRCFGKKYELTLLYEEMPTNTFNEMSKYFNCIKYLNNTNYVCDRLITTYSTYFYPKNIFPLERNYLFIHGNMSDYDNTRKFYEDLYTDYVAVSKVSRDKAKGYFPTDNITYITNPIKLDEDTLKPHLKLTSAFRYGEVKRPDSVELMAKLLEELNIPYTWNVFTDKKENTNEYNGLIFRKRVDNPVPYIKDSDYFVHLSDSEAMPYCVLEALAVNTKVVLTPLEAYEELGIKDGKNGIIIPFNYFEEQNIDKLKEVILKMYQEKDNQVKYKIDESLWDGYNQVFK